MQQGWICLHRGLLDWEWYNDINVTRLFIHCLLRANHKPKQWRGIDIARGQFWTSLPSLQQETGLSASQIRTCINKLKSTGELAVKSQATGRMVTVLKYNDYQENDRLPDRPVTDQSQTSDRQVTANNNDNKENNDNTVTKELISKTKKRFVPPTKEEVKTYMLSKGCQTAVDTAEDFCNYYESKGWKVGTAAMKSWTHAASRWLKSNFNKPKNGVNAKSKTFERNAKSVSEAMERYATPANDQKVIGHE